MIIREKWRALRHVVTAVVDGFSLTLKKREHFNGICAWEGSDVMHVKTETGLMRCRVKVTVTVEGSARWDGALKDVGRILRSETGEFEYPEGYEEAKARARGKK